MIVGQPAWHGLGVQVEPEDARDWRKVQTAAGLDWEITQRPLVATQFPEGLPLEVQSHVANVRSSDSRVLGVVGKSYQVLQNDQVFSWFAPFLEAEQATFEAAGALAEGSRIWALAKIEGAEQEVRDGDAVKGYLLLSHSHDGSLAIRVGFTPVRVVCSNTLTWAHSDEASKLIRIRHRGDVIANLESVRETMDVVRQGFFSTIEQYRGLANVHIQQKDVARYVELVLEPVRKANDEGEQVLSTKAQNIIDRIVEKATVGSELADGATPTLWDAYNGVTEWTSWERGRTQDSRINSLWYGDSAKINARALDVATEMAGAPARELVVVR